MDETPRRYGAGRLAIEPGFRPALNPSGRRIRHETIQRESQGQRAGARGSREHPAVRGLRLVTITGCEVSFDRSYCNVFYTTEPERYEDVAAGFAAASGRIRSLMGKSLSWRVTPELRFLLDPSVDEAEKITDALARDAARNAESAEVREREEAAAAELSEEE